MPGCTGGRALATWAKAGIFREVTGTCTGRPCGIWAAARSQSASCKAGKGSVPAPSTRAEQGGGYKRGDAKSGRGTEFGRSGGSTDDPEDNITPDEERTRGRPMGGERATDRTLCLIPEARHDSPYVGANVVRVEE